jgi:large subunit ribosomal protein L28
MAKVCDVCGKGLLYGNSIVRHGLPKKKGGIGLHTTGINRRRFLPNLHKVRVIEKGGTVRRVVCATCIKAGRVTKA